MRVGAAPSIESCLSSVCAGVSPCIESCGAFVRAVPVFPVSQARQVFVRAQVLAFCVESCGSVMRAGASLCIESYPSSVCVGASPCVSVMWVMRAGGHRSLH